MALCLPSMCRRPAPTERTTEPTLSPVAADAAPAPSAPSPPPPTPATAGLTLDAAVQALRPELHGEAFAVMSPQRCAGTDVTTLFHAMRLTESEWAMGCARYGGRWTLGAAVPVSRAVTAQTPGASAGGLPLKMLLLDGNAVLWQQQQDVGLLVPAAIREQVLGAEALSAELSGFGIEATSGVRLDMTGASGEDYRTARSSTILFRWAAGPTPLARVFEGLGGVTESQMDACSKVTSVEYRITAPGALERTERVTARFTPQPLDPALLVTLRRGCRSVAARTERIPIAP